MTKPKSAKTKTAAATIARLTVIAAVLALASSTWAQIVEVWPTNYSHTVTAQNNLGRFWPAWHTATRDSVILGGRVLTVAHVVYTDSPYVGTKIGAPRQLEERFVYRQIGGSSYRPIGGERIVYFVPQNGGWIASTNTIPPEQLELVNWQPSLVGTFTEGTRLRREIYTGSPLNCWGQNRARNVPYLVTYPCTGSGENGFNYDVRFDGDQARVFSLDLDRANATLNWVSVRWFTFAMDEAGEQPLPH